MRVPSAVSESLRHGAWPRARRREVPKGCHEATRTRPGRNSVERRQPVEHPGIVAWRALRYVFSQHSSQGCVCTLGNIARSAESRLDQLINGMGGRARPFGNAPRDREGVRRGRALPFGRRLNFRPDQRDDRASEKQHGRDPKNAAGSLTRGVRRGGKAETAARDPDRCAHTAAAHVESRANAAERQGRAAASKVNAHAGHDAN